MLKPLDGGASPVAFERVIGIREPVQFIKNESGNNQRAADKACRAKVGQSALRRSRQASGIVARNCGAVFAADKSLNASRKLATEFVDVSGHGIVIIKGICLRLRGGFCRGRGLVEG